MVNSEGQIQIEWLLNQHLSDEEAVFVEKMKKHADENEDELRGDPLYDTYLDGTYPSDEDISKLTELYESKRFKVSA